MRRKGRRGLIGVVATLAIAGLSTSAYGAHWETGNGPVDVCFTSTNLNATAVAAARVATTQWNAVTTQLQVTFGNCAPGDNVVSMRSGFAGGGGILAVTRWTGGEIIQAADITYDTDAIEGTGRDDAFMWRVVTCHEIGHALGLPHSDDPNSCMMTRAPRPTDVPGAGDVAQLRRDYGVGTNAASRGGPRATPASQPTASPTRTATRPAVPRRPAATPTRSTTAPRTGTSPGADGGMVCANREREIRRMWIRRHAQQGHLRISWRLW